MASQQVLKCWLVKVLVVVSCMWSLVSGHARLWEPPSRGSMWRRGYNTSANINDNELNCGGFTNQWVTYGGRCGVCGDPYQQDPRDHEIGGKFASGLVTRIYPIGAKIDVVVGLTANHGGYFEFKICPITKPNHPTTEQCFDKHPLRVVNGGDGGTRYYIKNPDVEGDVKISVLLPDNLHCRHCVFRWRYKTGSRWGCDKSSHCGRGHGPQEEFYGCSDIAVENVMTTIFIDPALPENATQPVEGLNDLGSSKSDWGKARGTHVKLNFNKPYAKDVNRVVPTQPTRFDRRLSLNKIKDNRGLAPIKPKSFFDLPGLAESQSPQSHLTRMAIPKPNSEQRFQDVTPATSSVVTHRNKGAARKFLENITFNAIISYYGRGGVVPQGVKCKAATRYQLNPIVQHYCSSECVEDSARCPALLCSCRSTGEEARYSVITDSPQSNTPVLKQNSVSKNSPPVTAVSIGHLKNFVRKLIDRNKLLETTTQGFVQVKRFFEMTSPKPLPQPFARQTRTRQTKTVVPPKAGHSLISASGKRSNNGYLNNKIGIRQAKSNSRIYKGGMRNLPINRETTVYGKQKHMTAVYGRGQTVPNTQPLFNVKQNIRPAQTLFSSDPENNNEQFNSFVKSTIKKTDAAKTKPHISVPKTRPVLNAGKPNTQANVIKPKPVTDLAKTKLASPSGGKVEPSVIKCTASEGHAHNPAMDKWCMSNCQFGFCPKSVCTCESQHA